MKCWKCGASQDDPPWGKLPFRATCDKCYASLHCCRNCVYYKPGLPNDCAVPGTDFIADREATNFCEDFKLLGKGPGPKSDPNAAAKRLFGDSEDNPSESDPKKRFNSLFGEDSPF